jgi:serine/threonine protein kinase
MTGDQLTTFLRSLQSLGLLDAEQWKVLNSEPPDRFGDVAGLAKELVRRGWLTHHQANLLYRGRPGDLMLGQYLLLDTLGGGGMGQVFKARHRQLGRIEAIKVIRDSLLADVTAAEQLRARFQRELQATARLSHPHIVKVHYADEDHGRPYMVMEYLDGLDLERLASSAGPLGPEKACAYLVQATQALQHLHERGMVHRDVKPRNLLVTRADDQVKLLDLGLVLFVNDAAQQQTVEELTRSGMVMGTRPYMAPEQLADSHSVDIRADLYSVGCTLYFLLTGKTPPRGPLPEVPDLPHELAAVLARLVAPRPEDRYPNPAEASAALAAFAQRRASLPAVIPVAIPVAAAPSALPVEQPAPAQPSTITSRLAEVETVTTPKDRAAKRRWSLLAGVAAAGLLVMGLVCGGGVMSLWYLVGRVVPSPGSGSGEAARPTSSEPPGQRQPPVAVGDRQPPAAPEPAGVLGASRILGRHNEGVLGVAFVGEDGRALTCSMSQVILWDLKTGKELKRRDNSEISPFGQPRPGPLDPKNLDALMVQRAPLVAVAVAPDGRKALLGGMDHFIVWDVVAWEAMDTFGTHSGGVLQGGVAFAADGRLALHVNQHNLVQIYNVDKKVEDLHIGFPGHVACFSADGAFILTGQSGNYNEKVALVLFDVKKQKKVRNIGEQLDVSAVALSADGHRALSASSRANDVVVWDMDKPAEAGRLKGHGKPVRSVAFSPDGRRALTGSEDATVRLWDVASGAQLGVFEEHTQKVTSVAFSPGGRYALSGSEDKTIGVWELPK